MAIQTSDESAMRMAVNEINENWLLTDPNTGDNVSRFRADRCSSGYSSHGISISVWVEKN